MFSVGIIGAGVIAKSHADTIMKNKKLHLKSVSEIDMKRGKKFASERHCKFYRDYGEMFKKENLDITVVCLPHHLHYEAGIAVLESGCHLFLEKPMANTIKECDRLIRKARKQDLKLMVGQTHQYLPSLRKARHLLDKGTIGRLNMIADTIISYYGWENRKPWHLDPAKGGGGPLMNTGPHQIDHLLYLTNSPPVYVKSRVRNNRKGIKVESDIMAFIEFKNGVSAILMLLQGYSPRTRDYSIRLIGSRGMIEINPFGNIQLSQSNKSKKLICNQSSSGFELEWKEFIDSIESNRDSLTNGEYGRRIVALIAAIYKSAREERSIRIK